MSNRTTAGGHELAAESNSNIVLMPLRGPATRRAAVVEQLRTAIVSGALPPGALIPEMVLARRLGVSATPVREAVVQLAAEGLVEIEAHRLKRVAPIDLDATRDLLKVQARLWRLGYQWGMANVGAAETSQLQAAVDRYGDALRRDDPLSAIRAGHDFHTIFIVASASRELLRFTLDRRALIARFILLRGRSTVSRRGLRHHAAMLAALQCGEYDEVLALLDQVAARLIGLAQPRG